MKNWEVKVKGMSNIERRTPNIEYRRGEEKVGKEKEAVLNPEFQRNDM